LLLSEKAEAETKPELGEIVQVAMYAPPTKGSQQKAFHQLEFLLLGWRRQGRSFGFSKPLRFVRAGQDHNENGVDRNYGD